MVGNDVVDLADRDGGAGPRHPRFDARVFAAAELRRLAVADDPGALRWILWSAKESAYKAARQQRPDTVFAPRRFVADVDAAGCGEVRHEGTRYRVRVRRRGDCVHAVATGPAAPGGAALSGVERLPDPGLRGAPEESGAAARRLAVAHIARRLGVPGEALRITRRRRVPCLWRADGEPAGWLSLSHHGRFVAYAFLAPPPSSVTG